VRVELADKPTFVELARRVQGGLALGSNVRPPYGLLERTLASELAGRRLVDVVVNYLPLRLPLEMVSDGELLFRDYPLPRDLSAAETDHEFCRRHTAWFSACDQRRSRALQATCGRTMRRSHRRP